MLTGRRARLLLSASMFVMGACGIIYEYVLSVLGNYLMGSSHEEIFIVIGLMMFAMGVGTVLQQRLRGSLVDAFLLLEITLGVLGGLSALCIYVIFAISDSYRIVLYAFSLGIGALIGMEIPILIRINREYAHELRVNLSDILSMDYAGSLAGALVFVYVLLTRVDLVHIGFWLGLANVTIAGVGLVAFRRITRRPRLLWSMAAVAVLVLGWGMAHARSWSQWAEQRGFADPIVVRQTSRYQHLVLTKRDERVRLYLNGHLQLSSTDEVIYHELLVHPAMQLAPRRERVLILGGGDGMALREVLKYRDVGSVTLVDLDAAVVRLASQQPDLVALNAGAFADARVRVADADTTRSVGTHLVSLRGEHGRQRVGADAAMVVAQVEVAFVDADLFLRRAGGVEPFDVVLVDFPDPSRLEIAKLYAREFYEALRRALAPGAIVAVQSTSPFHAKQVFLCIGDTLRAAGFVAMPYHQNVPSFGEWGFHLATPVQRGSTADEQQHRWQQRLRALPPLTVPTRYATADLIAASTVFGQGWLTSDAPIAVNTRLSPALVGYHRAAWRDY